jgi:hypothetical protein
MTDEAKGFFKREISMGELVGVAIMLLGLGITFYTSTSVSVSNHELRLKVVETLLEKEKADSRLDKTESRVEANEAQRQSEIRYEMNEFLARWRTESPSFFKNLAWGGKIIVGMGGAIMAVVIAAPELIHAKVIETLQLVASYLVFGGGIIVAISSLTVESKDELQDKIDNQNHEKNTNAGK